MTHRSPTRGECLAQADLLLLTADLLQSPASVPRDRWLVEEADGDALLAAAGLGNDAALADALTQAIREAQRTPIDQFRDAHTCLFEGAVACPVNETAYIRRDKGVLLADIRGFYRAFGFEPNESLGEKADHVVCQLQFAAMLLVMRAQAIERGDHEAADVTCHAAASFAKDHLGEWINAFADRLAATTALPFYEQVAALVRSGWQAVANAQRWPVAAPADAHRPELPEQAGTPYECDMADRADQAPVTLQVNGRPVS